MAIAPTVDKPLSRRRASASELAHHHHLRLHRRRDDLLAEPQAQVIYDANGNPWRSPRPLGFHGHDSELAGSDPSLSLSALPSPQLGDWDGSASDSPVEARRA